MELSSKWDGLDRNTQRYIATIAAGSRQQSRFIALVEDYDRNVELTQIAQDSLGASLAQFGTHLTGIGAATNRVTSAWEGLYSSWTQGSAVIPGVINLFADLVNILGSAGLGYTAISTGIIALTLNMAKYVGSMVLAQGAQAKFMSAQTQEAILAIGVKEAYNEQNEEIKEQIVLKAASEAGVAKEVAARILETGVITTETAARRLNTEELIANTKAKIANTAASLAAIAPIVAVVAGITALTVAIGFVITAQDRHIKKLKEEKDAALQASAAYAQQARSLESLKSQYQEAYLAGEDLTNLQEQLISQYPELAAQVSLAADSYDTVNKKIDDYIKKQKILQGQQASTAIAKDVEIQRQEAALKLSEIEEYEYQEVSRINAQGEVVLVPVGAPKWTINGTTYYNYEEAIQSLINIDQTQLELTVDALISVKPEFENSDFRTALQAAAMKEADAAYKNPSNTIKYKNESGEEVIELKPEIIEEISKNTEKLLDKLNSEVNKFKSSLDSSLTGNEKKQAIIEFSNELTTLIQKFTSLDGTINNIDLKKLKDILTPEQFTEYDRAVEQKEQEIIDKANIVDPETGLSPQQALQNATGHEGIATLMYDEGTEAGQAYINAFNAAIGNPEQQEKVAQTTSNLMNGVLDEIKSIEGFEDIGFSDVFESLSDDETALDFFQQLSKGLEESGKNWEDYEKTVTTVASNIEDVSLIQEEINKAFSDGIESQKQIQEAYDSSSVSADEAYQITKEFGGSLKDAEIWATNADGSFRMTAAGLDYYNKIISTNTAEQVANNEMLALSSIYANSAASAKAQDAIATEYLAYTQAKEAFASAQAQYQSELLAGDLSVETEKAYNAAAAHLNNARAKMAEKAADLAANTEDFAPGDIDFFNNISDLFTNLPSITPNYSGGSGGGGSSGGGGGGGSGESEAEKAAEAAKEAAEAAQEAAEAFQESIEVELEAIEKVLDKRKEALEKEIELMEEQRDEEEKSQRIQLNGFIKYLEKREELYEEHLDTLEKLADEAEKKAEEDNERLELQNEVVQDFYQNQIDAVQAKIDAINEEAEAEDKLQKLQEARDAYEQAKNTKNRLVLVQGAGWVFKRDQQAIKDTQAALETAEREKQIADLEKEIEILEEEAQKWADQAENIGKATSELEKYNEAYAQFAKLSDEERKQAYNDYVAALVQNNILNQAAIDAADRYDKESDENVEGSTAWNIEQIAGHIETVEELLDKISMDYDELLEEQLTNEQFEKFLSQLGTTGLDGVSGVIGDLTTSVEDFTNEYIVSYGELIAEKEKEIEAIEKAQDAWDELSDKVGKTTEELVREQELYNQYINMSTEALSENSEAFKRLSGEIDTLAGMLQEAKNLEEQAEAMEKSAKEGYSTGGVNTYTGLAKVHGTESRPEVILNNSQAGMLFRFIDGLAKVPTLNKRSNIPQDIIASTTTTEDNSTSYNNCNFAITSNENSLAGLLQDVKNLSPLKRF